MTFALATPRQIKDIHVLKGRAGLDDASYRAALAEMGVASSKELTPEGADRFIGRLRQIAPATPARPKRRSPSRTVSGKFAPVLRALWIAAHNLGIVRNSDDAALLAFVQRQTKVAHTRFLTDPADASRAIEALKAMLEREAGVCWPTVRDPSGIAGRRAVVEAQWRRLIGLGAVTLDPRDARSGRDPMDDLPAYFGAVARKGARRVASLDDATLTAEEYDQVAMALGRKLRAALADAARRAAP